MNRHAHHHPTGLSRREVLQAGYAGLLGLSAAPLLAAPAGRRQAKSVILVFLTGAPSHIDTFDPKPEAPPEIRGEFRPVQTSVAGLQICEHLPQLARRSQGWIITEPQWRGISKNQASLFDL